MTKESQTVLTTSPRCLRLYGPDCPEWTKYCIRAGCDFFHKSDYHRLSAEQSGAEPWMVVYGNLEKFIAWPYLLQKITNLGRSAESIYDVTSVYGYPGPLLYQCEGDAAFLKQAWAAFVTIWHEQSVVSVFTRFHPLLHNGPWVEQLRSSSVMGGASAIGNTVSIDLNRSQADIWRGYDRTLRQWLRRCEAAGVTTEWDPEWKYIDDFVRIYHSTMRRNNAAPFYFFTQSYFRQLSEIAGEHGGLLVIKYANEVIAATVLLECDGLVNAFLLASDERFVYLSPSKKAIHEAQKWAQASGHRVLHLGGGRGGRNDDPLFRFKSQFSNQFHSFITGRWILNQSAYQGLHEEHRRRAILVGGLDEEFFPSYRSPIVPIQAKTFEGVGPKAGIG
jgi:hypothetical protein